MSSKGLKPFDATPIAEYAKYLNEVNARFDINLKRDLEEYLYRGIHKGPDGRKRGGTGGLLAQIAELTPKSDNLGKDGDKSEKGVPGFGASASAVHAATLWRGNVVTDGRTTRVIISNSAGYARFLEYGSVPKNPPWPKTSSYPNPRTFKKTDPDMYNIHSSAGEGGVRIWAGGRDQRTAGGPVALSMERFGREGYTKAQKGFAFDDYIYGLVKEVRAALSGARVKERKR